VKTRTLNGRRSIAPRHPLLLAVLVALATVLIGSPVLAQGDAVADRLTDIRDVDIDWSLQEGLGTGLDPDQRIAVFVQFEGPPAAETWLAARRTPQLRSVANQRARQRLQELEQVHGRAEQSIRALGGRPLYRLSRLSNAIAANVQIRQVPALARLPGVIRVERVPLHYVDHGSSVSLIQAPQLWTPPTPGLTGSGMRIGIIDTGVDYLHTGFGGSGLQSDYALNDGLNGIGFPNAKVVGGYDFVGDSYNANDPANSEPMPDDDPMDCNGHGSHVAGTAAGYGVNLDGSPFAGPWTAAADLEGMKIAPGVAPEAQIYALRVFGCGGSTAVTVQAIEWAADPNGDGDFSDRLDVINMSLGSAYGSNSVVTSQASNLAGQLGIVVAASAGNSGDFFYNSGSPGAADWAIATASSVDVAAWFDGMPINAPASISGLWLASRSQNYPWSSNADVTADVYYPATNRSACAVFSGGEAAAIAGKIVLVDWIEACGSTVRANNVQQAGGVGAIMVWPAVTIGTLISGNATLPAIITNSTTGDAIKAELAQTVNVTLTDDFPNAIRVDDPALVDTLSSFSSRGPRFDNVLKPDISAPGQTILSIASGTGSQGASLNGTSMAAPHVAGAAALLRQLHPDWSAAEIKALLMNTASVQMRTTGAIPYSTTRQGAGRMALVDAAATQVIAFDDERPERVSLSFGALQVGGPTVFTRSVRVVNKGSVDAQYSISFQPFTVVAGASIASAVPTVLVQANSEATFDVELTADAASLARVRDATTAATTTFARHYLSELSGRIVLAPTAGADTVLRLPYHASLRPHTSHEVDARTLWFGDSDTISLAVKGAAPLAASYTPRAWALQLQAISPQIPGLDTEQSAADLKYVGVGSAPGPGGLIDGNTPVYFAIATHAPWSSPVFSAVGVEVYIDGDQDGTDDAIIFTTSIQGGADVFVTASLNLQSNQVTLSQFLNDFNATISTEPHNSTVMVLPAFGDNIGLPPGASRFDYRVQTYLRGELVDSTPTLTYDMALPALNAGAGSGVITTGRPRHIPADGSTIGVTRNQAALDAPLGLLMLYHLNDHASQAQILPMRTHGVTLTPAEAAFAGQPGATIERALVVTNTGNDTDTYGLQADGQWTVSVIPPSITLEPGASAPILVYATVPADSSPGDDDAIAVQVTSQENAVSTASATVTASHEIVRNLSLTGSTAQGGKPGSTIIYSIEVVNGGNTPDSVTVSKGASGWATAVSPTTLGPIAAGASAAFEVSVQVPAGAAFGATDQVQVTVQSDGDAAVQRMVTLTSTALASHGVGLAPANASLSAAPGASVVHGVQVSNTGNVPDTYALQISGNGWAVTAPSTVTVGAGQTATVQIQVAVPAGTAAAASDVLTATFTSQGDPTVSAAVSRTSTATAVRAVSMAGSTAGAGIAGSTVVYGITVTNTGNATDSFTASVGSTVWTVGVTPTATGPLAAGASATVEVSVQIPAAAGVGSSDGVTLTLTSAASAQATAAATLTTTVLPLRVFANGFED
jgi:subtilisin family serine protease/uncharacterized membrane protein